MATSSSTRPGETRPSTRAGGPAFEKRRGTKSRDGEEGGAAGVMGIVPPAQASRFCRKGTARAVLPGSMRNIGGVNLPLGSDCEALWRGEASVSAVGAEPTRVVSVMMLAS